MMENSGGILSREEVESLVAVLLRERLQSLDTNLNTISQDHAALGQVIFYSTSC